MKTNVQVNFSKITFLCQYKTKTAFNTLLTEEKRKMTDWFTDATKLAGSDKLCQKWVKQINQD